jgi:hypothetical protein
LFLDALWAEFEKIKGNKNRLFDFHKKLRSLTFLDPACGCGTFWSLPIASFDCWSWKY